MAFIRTGNLSHLREQGMALAPGILLAFTVATAATFLGDHYGAPVMLFALLLGMAFHFMSVEGPSAAGIQFTSKRLLRIGVALLGARVTLEQIFALGLGPIGLVVLCIIVTMLAGMGISRLFGRSTQFGILTGGAVAICGASAALAISAVLPKSPEADRDTLFTVIAVTALSTIAMIVYPIVFAALGFADVEVGILFGATIHDVAQVVGAGYAVSPETGDVATYVKLLRVALLPVVVIGIAFAARRPEGSPRPEIPVFAVAFGVILLVNSAGLIPPLVSEAVQATSRWLLVAAIAALGMKTSLKAMFELGPGHMMVVLIETLLLAVLAIAVSSAF